MLPSSGSQPKPPRLKTRTIYAKMPRRQRGQRVGVRRIFDPTMLQVGKLANNRRLPGEYPLLFVKLVLSVSKSVTTSTLGGFAVQVGISPISVLPLHKHRRKGNKEVAYQ